MTRNAVVTARAVIVVLAASAGATDCTTRNLSTVAVSTDGSAVAPSNTSKTQLRIPTGQGSTVVAELRWVALGGQELAIVREPQSGVTWWGTATERSTDFPERSVSRRDSAMVFADRKFIRFTLVIPELLVGESSAFFANLDAAQRAIVAGKAPLERWLTPSLSLPRDFLVVPNLANSRRPEIRSVALTREGWLITLAGPNGDFADVTLDDDFRVTNVRRYR